MFNMLSELKRDREKNKTKMKSYLKKKYIYMNALIITCHDFYL
jgi:hypothetical protein